MLKVYENIRKIHTWCKLTPNDSRFKSTLLNHQSSLLSPAGLGLMKIYNYLNLNYLKDFNSNVSNKKLIHEIENCICKGAIVEVEVFVNRLLELVKEYKHIWRHIKGFF